MCIVAGLVASASDMAGCRMRLAGNFEGSCTFEHESKCAKVHGIVASLTPMKDFPGVSGISMANLWMGRHLAG